MFYDPHQFALATELEANVQGIRKELRSLNAKVLDLQRIGPVEEFAKKLEQRENGWTPSWQVGTSNTNYNWLTYGLNYRRRFFPEADSKYPLTRSLLDRDEILMAAFSLLKPLSVIASHHHDYLGNGLLTLHLGIDVAAGTSFINVDGVFEEERAGKPIVFDGSREHFALNAGLEDRIVLYVEFDSSKG